MAEIGSTNSRPPSDDNFKAFFDSFERISTKVKIGERCVLIVDDEPTIRRMVSRSMTTLEPDLKIHEAENGRQAIEVLKTIRTKSAVDPVLIVTDLQMPVMDGWEFIDHLLKEYEKDGHECGIPLIVLSASSGTKGFFGGTSVHGDKCAYKPLVAISKEDCVKPVKYNSHGEQGLASWIKYFLREPKK